MSSFEVQIRRLKDFASIEGADRIEVARVDGYNVITQKGRFVNGDLAVYVPEAGVVPDEVLRLGGFWKACATCDGLGVVMTVEGERDGTCIMCVGSGGKGMLAGPKGNRVKPIKLKGVVSEGILLDLDIFEQLGFDPVMEELYPHEELEGKEVGAALGIKKYVVPIPTNLMGKAHEYPLAGTIPVNSDPENVKKVRSAFEPDEPVVIAEKVHGTALISGITEGQLYVSSKGLAGKGLVLDDEKDEQGRSINFYHRALQSIGGEDLLRRISEQYGNGGDVALYGEAYPAQDLKYGEDGANAKLAVFDIRVGGDFVAHETFMEIATALDIPTVPILYTGPYSEEVVAEHTDGREQVSGKEAHIREGVVVKPLDGRYDAKGRRIILKSISEKYLTRKGETTEFN